MAKSSKMFNSLRTVNDRNGNSVLISNGISSLNFDGNIPKTVDLKDASSIKIGDIISLNRSPEAGDLLLVVDLITETHSVGSPAVDTELYFIYYLDKDENVAQLTDGSIYTDLNDYYGGYRVEDRFYTISDNIDNLDIGSNGWFISNGGNAVFANGFFRGRIEATDGIFSGKVSAGSEDSGIVIGKNLFDSQAFSDTDDALNISVPEGNEAHGLIIDNNNYFFAYDKETSTAITKINVTDYTESTYSYSVEFTYTAPASFDTSSLQVGINLHIYDLDDADDTKMGLSSLNGYWIPTSVNTSAKTFTISLDNSLNDYSSYYNAVIPSGSIIYGSVESTVFPEDLTISSIKLIRVSTGNPISKVQVYPNLSGTALTTYLSSIAVGDPINFTGFTTSGTVDLTLLNSSFEVLNKTTQYIEFIGPNVTANSVGTFYTTGMGTIQSPGQYSKFKVGTSTQFLKYDSSTDKLTVTGTINATDGKISGYLTIGENPYQVKIGRSVTPTNRDGIYFDANNYWTFDDTTGTKFLFKATEASLFKPVVHIGDSGIIQTSANVGDGSASSAGIKLDATSARFYPANSSTAKTTISNSTGIITATDVNLTGAIKATSGYIGGSTSGWTINSGSIQSSGGVAKITLDATNAKLYVGTGTYGNANTPFYVDGASQFSLADKLTFTGGNLSITGAITATSGTFTGAVNASSGNFTGYVTAGTARFGAGVQTGKNGIWLNATNYWYDDGTINATLGTIGGWTLGSTTLTGTNTSLSNTGVITVGTTNDVAVLSSADATYRIWVGNSVPASAPFSVTKAGALVASTATITGTVNANAGNFTSTVTVGNGATTGQLKVGTNATAITILGANTAIGTKIYSGSNSTYNNTGNTGFYIDASGQFSIGSTADAAGLAWSGTALTVKGALTATSGSFTGTVNIQTGGSLVAGTTADGVTVDSSGLYGYEQGSQIFSIPTSSSLTPTIATFKVVDTTIYSDGLDANLIVGTRGYAGVISGGTIGTVTVDGSYTIATITGMTSATNLIVGQTITATSGTGTIPAGTIVKKVNSATSISVASINTLVAGTVTNITGTGGYNIQLRGQDSGGASPTTPAAIFTTINGATTTATLNNGFYVDRTGKFRLAGTNGYVSMDGSGNLTVSGTINASAGDFAGAITVNSGTMKIGKAVNSTNDGIYIGATGDYLYSTGAFRLGNTNGISYSGSGNVLIGTGVTVGGDISTATGTITGQTFRTSTTATTNGVVFDSAGIRGYNTSVKKFDLTSSGILTASDVDLTGKITASSGAIGSFNISTVDLNYLTGGFYSGMRPATLPFYSGATDTYGSSAKFYVRSTGYLYAIYGNLGGWDINSSGLSYDNTASIFHKSTASLIPKYDDTLGIGAGLFVANKDAGGYSIEVSATNGIIMLNSTSQELFSVNAAGAIHFGNFTVSAGSAQLISSSAMYLKPTGNLYLQPTGTIDFGALSISGTGSGTINSTGGIALAPSTDLYLANNSSASLNSIYLGYGTSSNNNNKVYSPAIYYTGVTTGNAPLVINTNNSIGKGTSTFKLKDNIAQLSNYNKIDKVVPKSKISNSLSVFDFNKILSISPVSYTTLIDGEDEDKLYIGFIAEDIAEKIPELAVLDEFEKPIFYDHYGITASMLAVVQNQQLLIEDLEKRIALLEDK